MIRYKIAVCLILLLTAGCSLTKGFSPPATAVPSLTPSSTSTPTLLETRELPVPTQEQPTLASTATLGSQSALTEVCSPLHGFQLEQLEEIISTPFDPPTPGSDSGHHGVDFSFYSYGPFSSMEGLPVQAVLDGKIAAVIDNRPPYGNMIIIETPLSDLPKAWLSILNDLPEVTDYKMDSRLACPTPDVETQPTADHALYLLYAHLADSPQAVVGDEVGCGQQIGFVGNSGFSGNTHLHLEARLGPPGVRFLHLAHYINNASTEEMANYCAWRIGPLFHLIDPIELLKAK